MIATPKLAQTTKRVNIEDRLTLIDQLDLEPIKYKLIRESGWTLESADRIEPLYKAYLKLHVLFPDHIHVPTVEIDDMWHAHILDTRKYMVDCFSIFGVYMHHYPYLGMKDEKDAERLQSLHEETKARMRETGMPVTEALQFADCGGGCGSSCGSSCSSGGGDSGGHSDGGHGHGGHNDGPSLPFPSSCGSSDTGNTRRDDDRRKQEKKPAWRWPWQRDPQPSPRFGAWDETVNPVVLQSGNRPGRIEIEAFIAAEQMASAKGQPLH